jgi:hypothetical protein
MTDQIQSTSPIPQIDLTDKLSPLLYMSKVKCLHECEMKYYFTHHLHLGTSQRPKYFADGSNVHRAVELGLIHGRHVAECLLSKQFDLLKTFGVELTPKDLETFSSLSDADCNVFALMCDAFFDKFETLGVKAIHATERAVKHPITSKHFTFWVVKADQELEFEDGLWTGDLKTTSGYGPAVAKYYHSAPQTKTYFRVLQMEKPELKGTKIFVVTKTKVPRCEVETICLTEADKVQAQLFMDEAIKKLDLLEDRFQEIGASAFSRSMTSCIDQRTGRECPFIPICINQVKSQAYIDELLNTWYINADPDDHLEL